MKITVRCGVFDGGRPCGKDVGTILRQDLDFAKGRFTKVAAVRLRDA